VSVLLLPKPARVSFCTRKVSSLVQRDEVMPPIEPLPYWNWSRRNSLAKGEGLFPGDFAPGIGDLLADHRIEDAVLVGGVAPGEAALDAGMAAVGLAVLVGHHADQFLAAHSALNEQPTPQ
jgi:hypothetical protein